MAENDTKYPYDIMEKSAGKNFWSAAVTNTFLELYKQYTPLLSKHRVQSFYEVLSTKLEEATGVSKTIKELQKKFSNLSRTYRNCLKKDSQKHEKFPYFNTLDEILRQDFPTEEPPAHLEHDLNFVKLEAIENEAEISAEPNFFPKREVRALIHLYAKEKIVCDAKLIDWNKISTEHKKTGFNRTPKECRLKMHNLLRSYKSCVNNKVTPNKCKFIYFNDLAAIFNGKGSTDFEFYKEYEQRGQNNIDQLNIPDGSSWTEQEIVALESCRKESKDWVIIAIQLEQLGFPERSSEEIQEKWKSLKGIDARDSKKPLVDLKKVFEDDEVFEEEVLLEEMVENKNSFNWTSKETRLLVDTYKKLEDSIKPGDKWEIVSSQMKMDSVIRTPTECAKKWYNLVRSYRLSLQKFMKTGNRPSKFFYFDDFQEILGNDPVEIISSTSPKERIKTRRHLEANLTTEEIESQLIEECNENLTEIIEEVPVDQSDIYCLDLMVLDWTYDAVEIMTNLYLTFIDISDENKRWNLISEDLEKKGFPNSVEDCKIKWNELIEEFHKCTTEDDCKKFRFYDLMLMALKCNETGFEEPTVLSKEKTIELIRLKNNYSIHLNTEVLPDMIWKNISDDLEINISPETLNVYYNELLSNYQEVKVIRQNDNDLNVSCQYFQEFDEIYAEDYEVCEDYEVVDETTADNAQIKEEYTQEVTDSTREINEEQLLTIASNFMRTCKFCLKQSKEEHLRNVTESMAEKINYVLHENGPKLVISISNLICSSCYVNIDHMYLYKKQYAENLTVIRDFSDKFSIEATSLSESNLANEYESFDEQVSEEEDAELIEARTGVLRKLPQSKTGYIKKRKFN